MGFVFPSALNSQIYSASILINFDSDLSRQFTINYCAAQDIKAVKGDSVIVGVFLLPESRFEPSAPHATSQNSQSTTELKGTVIVLMGTYKID